MVTSAVQSLASPIHQPVTMGTLTRRVRDRLQWEWREFRSPSRASFLQEELDLAIFNAVPLHPGERVLDVGCANGAYLKALRSRGAWVVGLDISIPSLKRAAADDLAVLAASGLELPFKAASFDTILCHKTLYRIESPGRIALEFSRVLRPGGRVVFSGSNTASPYARIQAAAVNGSNRTRWSFSNRLSIQGWSRQFAEAGIRTQSFYSCNLVWPLVFRVCDCWLIPNEWMRRYNRLLRRITRMPLQTTYPHGAAMDYVGVAIKT